MLGHIQVGVSVITDVNLQKREIIKNHKISKQLSQIQKTLLGKKSLAPHLPHNEMKTKDLNTFSQHMRNNMLLQVGEGKTEIIRCAQL